MNESRQVRWRQKTRYLWGYEKPERSPSLGPFVTHRLNYFDYFCSCKPANTELDESFASPSAPFIECENPSTIFVE